MAAPSIAMRLLGLVWLAASWELIHGQPDSPDFISIDCGLAVDGDYSDKNTRGLRYVPDTRFTDAGLNAIVRPPYYKPDWPELYRTVRYFPGSAAGARSCYTLGPVAPGRRYLVRARFYYGNYDGLAGTLPVFDIHIGVNRWTTVNITSANSRHTIEAVTVSPADFSQVCLVNTGRGTPFISGLELRPLGVTMYPEATVNQLLLLLRISQQPLADFSINRFYFGTGFIRYPDDPYDRSWQRYKDPTWTNINTTDTVDITNTSNFDKPNKILQTAATPAENTTRMDFTWSSDPDLNDDNTTYLLLLYFAELKRLPSNALRHFDILVDNAAAWKGSQSYTPKYISAEVVKTMVHGSNQHAVSLVATPDATLPPILNAFEIYSVKPMTELATNDADAKAMMTIRTAYAFALKKKNWMGDPCAPKSFAWDGLNCSYPSSGPASVEALLLSSSGLAGGIHVSFGDLKSLKYLDVSNNSLSGSIPDFLAQMTSLTFLDLSSNKLSGLVPAALLEKNQNRLLVFRTENNPDLCNDGASTCKSRRNSTIVIATVVPIAGATLLFAAAFIIIRNKRNKRGRWMANNSRLSSPQDLPNIFENRQFCYKELKLITANFVQEIGRGGFGGVFLGYLENGNPVAVKMRSKTSSQGDKEFLAEAQHLGRVHHKNLVSLIGYCKDKKHLALVYEYMHGGNLEGRLRGESATATPLTWPQRLKIALDSAHGLEYLHKSCHPPLIHRDVKTGNILLSADLEAKIADFGLMKVFADQLRTHVTTQPVGTLGYLDPEYYNTYQLSEKSDVYSFGVVLLELVTGQSPVVAVSDAESIHIAQWVRQKLSEGDITSIADPRMGGKYSVNSVWKVAELALQCKEEPTRKRPTMTDLVLELKECLELEVSHAMTYYSSSSVQSTANNIPATSVDLHTADQVTDHRRQHAPIYLEQIGIASTSSVGPTP